MARVVVPGLPHHLTQRGARRQETFLGKADYAAYRAIMAECCARHGVAVWAYCLLPSCVHLIAVPKRADGLRRAIGEAHRRYARRINAREGWTGHLWQGRFESCVMDRSHLLMAARYVETSPVAAGLVRRPGNWAWSSARAHLEGRDDALAAAAPLLDLVPDWADFLGQPVSGEEAARLERHVRTGRPLGDARFVKRLETRLRRPLAKRKPGPKAKGEEWRSGRFTL